MIKSVAILLSVLSISTAALAVQGANEDAANVYKAAKLQEMAKILNKKGAIKVPPAVKVRYGNEYGPPTVSAKVFSAEENSTSWDRILTTQVTGRFHREWADLDDNSRGVMPFNEYLQKAIALTGDAYTGMTFQTGADAGKEIKKYLTDQLLAKDVRAKVKAIFNDEIFNSAWGDLDYMRLQFYDNGNDGPFYDEAIVITAGDHTLVLRLSY